MPIKVQKQFSVVAGLQRFLGSSRLGTADIVTIVSLVIAGLSSLLNALNSRRNSQLVTQLIDEVASETDAKGTAMGKPQFII